jgi:hypothetical protein
MLPEDTFKLGEKGEAIQNSIEEAKKYDEKIGKKFTGYPTQVKEEEEKPTVQNTKDDQFNMNGDNTIVESTQEQVEQAKQDALNADLPIKKEETAPVPPRPVEMPRVMTQVVQQAPMQQPVQPVQPTQMPTQMVQPQVQQVQVQPRPVTVNQVPVQPVQPRPTVQVQQSQQVQPFNPVQPVINSSIINSDITGNLGGAA